VRGCFVVRRLVPATVLLLLTACPAFSASLFFSPVTQTVDEACVVCISAHDLVSASGFDLEITWDADIVECVSAVPPVPSPFFDLFRADIDNEAGRLEAVLIRLSQDGFSGDVDSLLVLTFTPVAAGTSALTIADALPYTDPVVIDEASASAEVETTAGEIVVDIEPTPSITAVRLRPNYPNPFNPGTTVIFDIPSASSVTLRIFDAGGRLVRTLLDGRKYAAGRWEEEWDGRNDAGSPVRSGIYFCVLDAAGQTDSRKMVVLR
jgi:hypothetical protein